MFCPGRAPLNPDEALGGLTLPHRKRHSAQRFVHRPKPAITDPRYPILSTLHPHPAGPDPAQQPPSGPLPTQEPDNVPLR
jgi:hypothetical protein